MTSVGNVYAVIDDLKRNLKSIAETEDVSELLIWMLLRQVADYELMRVKEREGLLETDEKV